MSGDARVLYLALQRLDYPRYQRLASALARGGYSVDPVLLVDTGSYLGRCWSLLRAGLTASGRTTALVVLAEFSIQYAWVGWVISKVRRCTYLVDWFVGMYETNVADWGRYGPATVKARRDRWADWTALRLADLVVTDTSVRAQWLQCAGRLKVRPIHLPVGAPAWAQPSRRVPEQLFRVLYYGNYIPLHGVEFAVRAMSVLPATSSARLHLIGDGELKEATVSLVAALGLGSVCTFESSIPEADLAARIHESDVVLGIFGSSEKAATVIANKVWQGLACGRPVITRQSAALEELAPLVGEALIQTPAADPAALASAIGQLEGTPRIDDGGVAARLERYVEQQYELLLTTLRSRSG